MARASSLTLLVLSFSVGCRVLDQADLTAWKQDHGIVDSDARVDTGLPMEPTEDLCTDPWGRVSSAMDDEEWPRTVQAGSAAALMFWFEGPTDLCELGCDVEWVDAPYVTSDENYTLEEFWIDLPYRHMGEERFYAYYYLNPDPDETPGEQGECWVDTSAGRRSFQVQIMEI